MSAPGSPAPDAITALVDALVAQPEVAAMRAVLHARERHGDDDERALALADDLHGLGLLDDAARVLAGVRGEPARALLQRVEDERAVLADAQALPPAPGAVDPVPRRVLHVVRDVADEHVLAVDRAWGLDSVVVTALGVGDASDYRRDTVDGVVHFRLPGGPGGDDPLREHVRRYAQRLATVVRTARPAVVHVRHDRCGTFVAVHVANALGVPVVVEAGDGAALDAVVLRVAARAVALVGARPGAVRAGAVTYVQALERAGLLTRGSGRVDALRPSDADRDVLAGHLRSLAPDRARLEASAWSSTAGDPDVIAADGWVWSGLPAVVLDTPVDWHGTAAAHRSQAFHLHAWDFMGPALRDYARTGAAGRRHWCTALAVDWCRTFDDDPVLGTRAEGTMAWYDMALALRAPRLAFLLQEAVRHDADAEVVDVLYRAVVHHQRALVLDRSFAAHNNHGFYTAVGQLAFARRLAPLPGTDELWRQGMERLRAVADRQFAADGGHLEHSPDYHRMLVASFSEAVGEGLVDDPEVLRRVESALDVLGWFVQPDGTMVQIGDSPAKSMRSSGAVALSSHAAWAASGGERGTPPDTELKVLPQSGYAVVRAVRDGDPRRAGYLTLMAGFHSRTHKHADDLSLTWCDQGVQILCDAGRFGYLDLLPKDSPDRARGFFYSRPERQYVESTRAHCTVELDGRDHERRARTPYGSALGECGAQDGTFLLRGEVDHGSWRHRRTVRYRPGAWLDVEDDVTVTDDDEHTYRAWWNLDGALTVAAVEEGAVAFARPDGGRLWVTTWDASTWDGPVSGQQDPLRGWRSPVDHALVPSWSLAAVAAGRGGHRFRTLLSLGDERPRDLPA